MKKQKDGKTGYSVRRAAAIALAAAGIVCLHPVSSQAAEGFSWQQSEMGRAYINEAGISIEPGWQQIDGAWYFIGEDGYAKTGWLSDNGHWYYLDESGAMATGFRKLDGKYYYLKANGAMENGTFKDGETVYIFNADGSLLSAKKARNTGGGSFDLGFYDKECQALANNLNELKLEDFDGDEDEDYYEDDKVDYDKDASFLISGRLTEIAEHRLSMALSKGYGNGKIPDEGELSDYIKSISYNTGRRFLEVYLRNCDDADDAENKLLRSHGSGEKKRRDQATYYKEMGIAHQEAGGKNYYMVIFMR